MPTAVTLIDDPTTHLTVKGIALEGLVIEPRSLQSKISKFWGVNGESHIVGGYGGRNIIVPVLIYDATDFDTAEKLSDYINHTLNGTKLQTSGVMEITSPADHDPFPDTIFNGFELIDGPKHDDGGALGGGYFAMGRLLFRQTE